MTDGHLDELARSLARPVSRRSALRLLGGALVAAGASGLLPSRGRAAIDDDPCPTCADRPGSLPCCVRFGNGLARVAIGQCYYPGTEQCCTGPSAYDGYPTAWICSKYDKCGADGVDLCIGQCHTEDGDVSIDFETQCCTPSGIEPKYEGFSLKACANTLTTKKGVQGADPQRMRDRRDRVAQLGHLPGPDDRRQTALQRARPLLRDVRQCQGRMRPKAHQSV